MAIQLSLIDEFQVRWGNLSQTTKADNNLDKTSDLNTTLPCANTCIPIWKYMCTYYTQTRHYIGNYKHIHNECFFLIIYYLQYLDTVVKNNTGNSICIKLHKVLNKLITSSLLYLISIISNYTTSWICNTFVCFSNFGSLASLKYPALLLPLPGLAQVSFFSLLISYITGGTNCSLVLSLYIFPFCNTCHIKSQLLLKCPPITKRTNCSKQITCLTHLRRKNNSSSIKDADWMLNNFT